MRSHSAHPLPGGYLLYDFAELGLAHQPGRTETLEVAFDTKSLRAICESEAKAKRELGPSVGRILKHRLADFRAAKSAKDFVAGQPRFVRGTGRENMAVDLCDGYRIVFTANHPKGSSSETRDVNWERVSRIKILRIGIDDV